MKVFEQPQWPNDVRLMVPARTVPGGDSDLDIFDNSSTSPKEGQHAEQ